MDISKASNFERFVFDLVGRDSDKTRALWSKVDNGNSFDLNADGYFAKISDYGFVSGSSNHTNRIKTIRETQQKYGVVIDTHTADGLKVALEYFDKQTPMVVLETALPAKFEESIIEALGQAPERPAVLNNIEDLPQRFTVMDADAAAIKQFIIEKTS
jgi:threonine synthase